MGQKAETIIEKLKQDMVAALKSGDKERLSALRMLIAELKNAQIAARKELSRTEEEKVLSLVFQKSSFRSYRERIWYLDIIRINDLVNHS